MEENTRLIAIGEYPEIYADGIGDVHFLQYTTRIVFFAWRKIDGVYRRGISGTVMRPTVAFGTAQIIGLQEALRMPLWHPKDVAQIGAMRMH